MGEAAAGQGESCAGGRWIYRRREPERSPLYAAECENLGTLLGDVDAVGHGLKRNVARDFERYLDCEQLAQGFARVRCNMCRDVLLVVFGCKGLGVCPSRNAKRAHRTVHLAERVLLHVSYRQRMRSIPFRLRLTLARDGKCMRGD